MKTTLTVETSKIQHKAHARRRPKETCYKCCYRTREAYSLQGAPKFLTLPGLVLLPEPLMTSAPTLSPWMMAATTSTEQARDLTPLHAEVSQWKPECKPLPQNSHYERINQKPTQHDEGDHSGSKTTEHERRNRSWNCLKCRRSALKPSTGIWSAISQEILASPWS